MNTTLLEVFNDQYERGRTITKYDQLVDILEKREKETFVLKGISGLDIISSGVKIAFDVGDVDENLIPIGSETHEDEFFISKYVWNHLCGYLGIPSDVWNYLQRFRELEELDFTIASENEAENMRLLFNNRLEKVEKSNRTKNIFITVFDDVFGRFPRVIRSEVYYPYADSLSIQNTHNGLMSLNASHKDREYEFDHAFITPYQTTANWNNKLTKTLAKVGDEIESGITNINSECKLRSLTFTANIKRLVCSNGAVRTVKSNDLRIRHYESGFEKKIKHGFVTVLNLENEFARDYLKAGTFDTPFELVDNWTDLMDKIPSSILSMKSPEKAEVARIGESEKYQTSPYGLIQALTYKSSHEAHDDNTRERINEKAINILDNIEAVASWKPKTKPKATSQA